MKIRRFLTASMAILALAGTSAIGTATAWAEPAVQGKTHEMTVAYFRAWRDTHSDPTVNFNSMSDLPKQVDIAIAFPNPETTQAFWDTLPGQIESLHKQGTKVIRSLDISLFYKDDFNDPHDHQSLSPMESNAEGYAKRASELKKSYLYFPGLDGFVVNAEASMTSTDVQRATGVLRAMSSYYGPKSPEPSSIFAYNTNKPGTNSLYRGVSDVVSYVFADAYGRSVGALQRDWETYKGTIKSRQYIPGFSFYEERGGWWYDTEEPMSTSRAMQYALWEPDGGADGAQKGGIFEYAVDRDGVRRGDDKLQPTTFEWTKALSAAMNKK